MSTTRNGTSSSSSLLFKVVGTGGFLSLGAIGALFPILDKNNDAVQRTGVRSPLITTTYWTILGTGVVALVVKGISNIKIGITRTLGLPVMSNPAADQGGPTNKKKEPQGTGRRLGLLERWYAAHSRRGNHTGLTVAVELESNDDGQPTVEDVRRVLHRVALRLPLLRARIYRDGVVHGMDDTERLIPT